MYAYGHVYVYMYMPMLLEGLDPRESPPLSLVPPEPFFAADRADDWHWPSLCVGDSDRPFSGAHLRAASCAASSLGFLVKASAGGLSSTAGHLTAAASVSGTLTWCMDLSEQRELQREISDLRTLVRDLQERVRLLELDRGTEGSYSVISTRSPPRPSSRQTTPRTPPQDEQSASSSVVGLSSADADRRPSAVLLGPGSRKLCAERTVGFRAVSAYRAAAESTCCFGTTRIASTILYRFSIGGVICAPGCRLPILWSEIPILDARCTLVYPLSRTPDW